MERMSSATSFFCFFGTLARMLRATCTWQRWTLALGNSSLKTASNPGNPSIIPRVTFWLSSPLDFKSLKNSRQLPAVSLSPDWRLKTSLHPFSVTPMATSTGTVSMLFLIRMWKFTPSTKIYLTASVDKSRCLQLSTASDSSLLALLISVWDRCRPISRCRYHGKAASAHACQKQQAYIPADFFFKLLAAGNHPGF